MRLRVDLLTEEADVVRERDHPAHGLARLVQPTGTRERLDEPERAGDERALLLLLAAVAVEERPARTQLVPDRVDRRAEPFGARVEVAHPRQAEDARVELVAAWIHDVRAARVGPAFVLDELAQLRARVTPLVR